MSLQMETSELCVLILYSLGFISGCMFTSVLVLSIVLCKNRGSTNLLNGRWKRNNSSHEISTETKYNVQETMREIPCSRDELEEFVAREEISRNSEERVMKTSAFTSPWSRRPVEKEDDDKAAMPLEIEPNSRKPAMAKYDKPRSPPLEVVIPIEIQTKKTELRGVEYDKPRLPPLKVVIPIELEPKRSESEMIEETKKNEETYVDMSRSSLYTNQAAAFNCGSCHQGAALLPTPPPSPEQKQQHEGHEYKSLENIYEEIDRVKKIDQHGSNHFITSTLTASVKGVFP